ncbi:NUDIX hydrolase [Nonomuraea sediminis]|uniref:NUDIX hydrolase n=1 Tax=Nonomuraea sediminis TaxID=2835864 RepID=UPI001BDD4639|nr:NUDIX hydrolase [Nonomuraea sediminis]
MRPNPSLVRYRTLRRRHPDLFANPQGAGTIILDPRDDSFGVRYKDAYVTLVRDRVRFPDGRIGAYVRLLHTSGIGGAAILPVRDGKVVLVRHFRHATRRRHWEIPRGFADLGESFEETARREAGEELQMPGMRVRELGRMHADSGLIGTEVALYWAELEGEVTGFDAGEGIDQVLLADPAELDSMLERGEITDSFTLAALLHARRLRLSPFQ